MVSNLNSYICRKLLPVYKFLIRPLLFLLPAETAHHFTFGLVRFLYYIPGMRVIFRWLCTLKNPRLEKRVFDLNFPNPVGLAAGFDKDAKLVDALSDMGFGFVEIGTVTPKAQAGNTKPRLFRLPADGGLINRMGFNNLGVAAAVNKLKNRRTSVIIGGNIGKNKDTPNEHATDDYLKCFEALYPYVDYFVVNVSSPNTPGLRDLQEKEPLLRLLNALQSLNKQQSPSRPLLLKIAPDLTNGQLDDIIDIVNTSGIDGIVATNTTIDRSGLSTPPKKVEEIGAGGLSGTPLEQRSTEVIRYLYQKSNGNIPIVGVGGIMTPQDAWNKLQAGASLVQVYTGFVYQGPSMVRKINKYLLKANAETANY